MTKSRQLTCCGPRRHTIVKVIALALSVTAEGALAQDINLTNRVASFTNLQGQAFTEVQLVRGDLDGVIWRKESSGGRVCYTNLDCRLLEGWGIPTNRIEIARTRAEHKALTSTQVRAWALKQAQLDAAAKAKAEAEEAALAPLKARAVQMTADREAIATFEEQIQDAKTRMRRAKAVAHDYNMANLHNDYAPTLYVKEIERVKIEEAEARSAKMKEEFALKYKSQP